MATKPPFAALAVLGLSDGGNEQEADFNSKKQCFGAVDSSYADKTVI